MKLESWGYVFPLLTRRPPVRPPETRFLRHETRRTRQSRQALPPAHAGTVPSQGTDTRSGASREPTTTVYAFDYASLRVPRRGGAARATSHVPEMPLDYLRRPSSLEQAIRVCVVCGEQAHQYKS